jgi:hypothetical protein
MFTPILGLGDKRGRPGLQISINIVSPRDFLTSSKCKELEDESVYLEPRSD